MAWLFPWQSKHNLLPTVSESIIEAKKNSHGMLDLSVFTGFVLFSFSVVGLIPSSGGRITSVESLWLKKTELWLVKIYQPVVNATFNWESQKNRNSF